MDTAPRASIVLGGGRRKDGEGALQITVYRVDYKQAARLDVTFKVADMYDKDGIAEARAEAHVALDTLLDKLLGRTAAAPASRAAEGEHGR